MLTKKYKDKFNKTKKFKLLKCAPKKKNLFNSKNDKEYTCFKNDILFMLKENWNSNNSKKIESNDPKEIWHHLKKSMSKTCHKESCWLRHQCIKHDLPSNFYLQNFFATSFQ